MNPNNQNKYATFGIFLIDCLVISCLFIGLLYIRNQDSFLGYTVLRISSYLIHFQYKSFIFLLFSWFLISQYLGSYKYTRFERYLDYIRKSIFQVVLFAFVLFAISGIKNEDLFSNKQSFYFIIILGLYILLSRTIFFFVNKWHRSKGLNNKNIIIIGYNQNVDSLINLINERKDYGLNLTNHFVVKNPKGHQEVLTIASLKKQLEREKIDYIYVCLNNGLDENTIDQVTQLVESFYISIGFIPDNFVNSLQNLEISYLDTYPVLTYKKYPLDNTFNQIIKRIFDLGFTLIVFSLILWWLLPTIALMVYFTQGKPIFFKQKRNGLNGKEFDCLKFRTMRHDKSNSIKPTERNDPRVTKLGRILRKTSLDELPQFINVLKGEMSIVGPRPHMVSENETYSEIINRYALRHYVKPGITGLAQVKGYRGAIDTDKDMEMRIRTDIYYVRNWSFLLDVFIIYKTGKLMIFGDENAI